MCGQGSIDFDASVQPLAPEGVPNTKLIPAKPPKSHISGTKIF